MEKVTVTAFLVASEKDKNLTRVHFLVRYPQHVEGTDGAKKYKYERFKISTKQEVNPKFWDGKKERVKSGAPNAGVINSELAQMRAQIMEIATQAGALGQNPIEALRARYFPDRKRKKVNALIKFIATDIERRAVTQGEGSLQVYRTVLRRVKEFNEAQKIQLDFDTVTPENIDAFARFLIDEFNNTNNTVEKALSTLKTFLIKAEKEGVKVNPLFRGYSSAKFEAETTHYALSLAELRALAGVKLDYPNDEKVRDGFIVMCFTGLRFSDLMQLKREHITTLTDGTQVISLLMKKTRERIYCALPGPARELCEKHNFDFAVANPTFNLKIKQIAEKAGINEPVETIRFRGKETIKQTVPKHDAISAHSARRTYATLQAENGFNQLYIKDNLGHAKLEQTEKYLKLSDGKRLKETSEFFDKLF